MKVKEMYVKFLLKEKTTVNQEKMIVLKTKEVYLLKKIM